MKDTSLKIKYTQTKKGGLKKKKFPIVNVHVSYLNYENSNIYINKLLIHKLFGVKKVVEGWKVSEAK